MDIRTAIAEGRYAEAAAYLRPSSDQGSSDSSNNLAIIYRRMGQPANELFFAHRAFEQNRLSSSALHTLLRALLAQGLFQPAARIYREVRSDRHINRSHHINGAIALIRINRVDEAAEALDQAGGFPSAAPEDLKIELLMAQARVEHDRAWAGRGSSQPDSRRARRCGDPAPPAEPAPRGRSAGCPLSSANARDEAG